MHTTLPELVLLHGFCESGAIFAHLLPELATFSRPLAPDLPGFGREPHQPRIRSIDDMAFWLRDHLDALGLESVVLAGHSMGGYIALAFADHFPDRVQGLGLIHTTALPDTEERRANRSKTAAFIEAHGTAPFLDVFVPSLFHDPRPAWLSELRAIGEQAQPEAVVAMTRAMRDRPDRVHVAAGLQAPVMYVAGLHDALVPIERNRTEWAQLQMAAVKILDRAGHMGMYEDPAHVVEALASLVEMSRQ